MSSTIHLQWKNAEAAGQYRTGVSLHSHTLHSHESLSFIYHAATRAPILSAVIRQGERVYRRMSGHADLGGMDCPLRTHILPSWNSQPAGLGRPRTLGGNGWLSSKPRPIRST
jgi:hypothetical protein